MDPSAYPKTLQEVILDKLPENISLFLTVMLSNKRLVQRYLDGGADVMPVLNGKRFSLLHLALYFKYLNFSDAFVRVGADIQYQDCDALLLKSETETSEIVEALIKAGTDVNVQDLRRNTALHLAAEQKNSRCIKALTEADADVNLQNIDGVTALHLASLADVSALTETLIKAGAEINKQALDGRTALHNACTVRYIRNVELLMNAGANINVMASNGWSALHFVFNYFPRYDLYFRQAHGNYFPYKFIDDSNEYLTNIKQIVKLLIDAGIDVNQTCKEGTALHRAVTIPDTIQLVEELIHAGIDVNIQNDSGETAVHVAFISNDGRIVQILTKAGVDVNKLDKDGNTALHPAAQFAANETVRELIAAGVDINRQNSNGDTALHLCSVEVLEILISNGACANIKNKFGIDPLQHTKQKISSLIEVCKLHEYFKLYRDSYGNTIFHFLLKKCNPAEELATLIQTHQLDFAKYLSIQNMFGHTPLHIAASKETLREETLDLIFSSFDKCDLDLLVVDENGNTFFHTYMSLFWSYNYKSYNITFIGRFLGGEYICCSTGNLNKLVQLRNKMGNTPLHIHVNKPPYHPVVCDFKSVLEMFVKVGANISLCNKLGDTVLHSLLNFCEQQAAIEFAVENGAVVNSENIFGESPIFVIPSNNDLHISSDYTTSVKLLVNLGAKMDVSNKIGQTPLMVHTMKMFAYFPDVVSMFDINKQDINGSNLLHYIAWTYSSQIVDYFDHQYLFNLPFHVREDNLGLLPCDIAYSRGHRHMLEKICICKNGVHKEKLVFCPSMILFRSLKQKDDVFQNCIQTKCKYFSEASIKNIMNEPFLGLVEFEGEAKEVKTAVVNIVQDICRRIGEKDELLKNTVIMSGSVAENTKVGLPDEFDFLCVLHKMPELFYIEEISDKSYVNLKLKEVHWGTAYGCFFEPHPDFSISKDILLFRFHQALREIMHLSDIYKHQNIFHVYKYGLQKPYDSPNFAISLKWSCGKYKNMTLKLDLVPVCRITCPPDSKLYSNTFNPATNENEELLIMFQPVFKKEEDFIISTYGVKDSKVRTSAVEGERKLLKTLPQESRDAYVISKILCCDRVCPAVKDVKWASQKHEQNPTCASFISSYMLKNCLFHVAQEEMYKTLSKLSVHGYVCKIFEKLLKCSLEENLPCYMFPWQNLFTFLSQDSEHNISIMCRSRAMYAKLILSILGKNEDFNDVSPELSKSYSINDTHKIIQDNNICANCKKSPVEHGIKLETCSRCKLWTYCCVKCREENWERHKLACDYYNDKLVYKPVSDIIYTRL